MLKKYLSVKNTPILKKIYNLRYDSLFRNSFYLMLATVVMAAFGFFFWIITTKIFATKDIGIATTLISIMSLIGAFSLLGFGTTFVRFLPTSKNPNDKLNTGMVIVSVAAIILSSLFLLFVKIISPKLGFITESPVVAVSFVFFCIMTALNVLTDSVFLARRQAKFTLIINTAFSAIKMILPFAFIKWGATGIFMAAAIAQTVGFILSVLVMIWKFDYRPQLIIKTNIIKQVWRYSISNYVAGIFSMIPASLLPVIITNHLGAETSAYFYIAVMIGNLLFIIPRATDSSLFAESSNDELSLNTNIKKSIKIIAVLLIPSILVLLFGGGFILRIFGDAYATNGLNFLRLISISAISLSAYNLFNTLFYVKKNLREAISINALYAGSTIAFSYIFLPFGLNGIGFAWLCGYTIAGLAGYITHKKLHKLSD